MTIVFDNFSSYANGALATVDSNWTAIRGTNNLNAGVVYGDGSTGNTWSQWKTSVNTFTNPSQYSQVVINPDNSASSGASIGPVVYSQSGGNGYYLSVTGSNTAGNTFYSLNQASGGAPTQIATLSFATDLTNGAIIGLYVVQSGGNPILTCTLNGLPIVGLNASAVAGVSGTNGVITDGSAGKITTVGQPGILAASALVSGNGVLSFQGGDYNPVAPILMGGICL